MKIFFISHWGWGLYKSRAEMAKKIKNSFTVNAICPKDEFYKKIIDTYDEFFEWNVNRTESNIRQILSTYNLSKIIKKNQKIFYNCRRFLFQGVGQQFNRFIGQ